MGAQPGTVTPAQDFTHPAARRQKVSGAANAEGYFRDNVVLLTLCEVSEGRIGCLLFSSYPKYPNNLYVPLYCSLGEGEETTTSLPPV